VRKLYSFMVITLDGFYEGPNQEFDWPNVDEEFNEFGIEQLNDSDVLLFGRVTYEGMAGYWPTPAARQDDPRVAELMNTLPKIVVSTTLTSADWNNTRLVGGNVDAEITKLKQQPGKGLGQAMRRRTSRTATSTMTTARATNRAVSMPWNSQKRSAGWYRSWL
jgi:dihydrofolate reductase